MNMLPVFYRSGSKAQHGLFTYSLCETRNSGQIYNLFLSDFQPDEISWLTISTPFSTTMINTEDMIWTEKQAPTKTNLGKSWNTLIS